LTECEDDVDSVKRCKMLKVDGTNYRVVQDLGDGIKEDMKRLDLFQG